MGGTVSRPKCVRGRLLIGALLSVLLWSLTGCVPPPSPMERLTDAAYDLNTATRFGRFDVAMGYVEPGKQLQFAHRHAKWGQAVRVLDVDLVSIRPVAEDVVEVQVMVAWHRIDEMTMRQSRVAQRWQITDDDWRMVEERRVGGSPGLFTPVRSPRKKSKADESKG